MAFPSHLKCHLVDEFVVHILYTQLVGYVVNLNLNRLGVAVLPYYIAILIEFICSLLLILVNRKLAERAVVIIFYGRNHLGYTLLGGNIVIHCHARVGECVVGVRLGKARTTRVNTDVAGECIVAEIEYKGLILRLDNLGHYGGCLCYLLCYRLACLLVYNGSTCLIENGNNQFNGLTLGVAQSGCEAATYFVNTLLNTGVGLPVEFMLFLYTGFKNGKSKLLCTCPTLAFQAHKRLGKAQIYVFGTVEYDVVCLVHKT